MDLEPRKYSPKTSPPRGRCAFRYHHGKSTKPDITATFPKTHQLGVVGKATLLARLIVISRCSFLLLLFFLFLLLIGVFFTLRVLAFFITGVFPPAPRSRPRPPNFASLGDTWLQRENKGSSQSFFPDLDKSLSLQWFISIRTAEVNSQHFNERIVCQRALKCNRITGRKEILSTCRKKISNVLC